MLQDIVKTKARRSRQQAEAEGDLRSFELNDRADTMVKPGAAHVLRDQRAAFAELARCEDLVGGLRKVGHVLRD